MLRKITAALFIFYALPCIAKDLGVIGQTFEIKERSLVEVIQEKLNRLQQSGEIVLHQQELQRRVEASIERPVAVSAIKKATAYKKHTYDPTLVLSADIKDHKGRVFAKKGETYNPLDYLSFGDPLLFIDGDDPDQVQWSLKQKGKRVLVKGAPLSLSRQHHTPFYFDQGGSLTTKLGIFEVPARVSQDHKVLVVEILPVKGAK